NTIKTAEFGFDVLPAGGGSDQDTADIFKGYLRWMQNNARGESPVEWAADQGVEGGIGWFRLRSDYVTQTWNGPLTPEVMWQALFMERITNNLTVYCDPSAMKPTRSDAQWMFVTEDMARDEFERKYPNADIRDLEAFTSTGDTSTWKAWVSKDIIRIAEYYRIVYTNRHLYLLTDGTVTEEKPDDKKAIKQERIMRVPSVKCDKINAVQSLESYDWPGSRIPLIPVLGEELNVDGKVWLRGIIEEGMDAQRMVNYTYSGAVEIFALAPKNAPMIPAAAVANYKAIWQSRNIVNHSYLPYDPWDQDGKAYPQPLLDTTEPPIQAAVELMRVSEDAIKATTSTGDASLGNTNPNERSGRALQALQSQSDLANSNYPDNVRRALIYAGELAIEVIPKITQKGQIIHILGMDDEPQSVMVGQPYQEHPDTKVPQASPPEITPEMASMSKGLHKFYDLNNGRYAVAVSVGKATATKQQESSAAIGQLIPHLPPEMAAVATPEYVEQLSFPGAHQMAEKLRKALPPQLQDQDGQNQIPPQAQAMIQQLQQKLQEATQFIQTKQAEQQGSLQEAQMKSQVEIQKMQADTATKLKIAEMDNATKIAVARISAAKTQLDPAAEAAEERLATGLEMAHEVGMAAMEHQHTLEQNAQDHQHTLEQGSQQAVNAQTQQAADQAHQSEMAQQAAEQAQQNGGGNA
ncbi:MAG TPA: portal protein, partial [Candidatus Saccharimonadales bacterium]|nr:portal protein [Candidatus Saccharimonadales bacterium]